MSTDKSNFEYVTIPERDMYDFPIAPIWINSVQYAPGTHLLEPLLAQELREILKRREESDLRLMRPGKHRKSLDQVSGSPNAQATKET